MSNLYSSWENALSTKLTAYNNYVTTWEEKIGSFIEFDPSRHQCKNPKGKLANIPFGVKDNIATEGFRLTCGSKMLENLDCPYTATVVQKLIEEGAVVTGKTNLDEFGMGSSTDNSALKKTNNPWDISRVSGGSSGGSAAAVTAGLVPFALGSDTGGSIRQPAAFCGVYGLKPTYGSVSRYGLTAYASSLEVVGALSRSVDITESVFDIIKGQDPLDHSSLEYTPSGKTVENFTVAVLDGDLGLNPEVEKIYKKTISRLKELGMTINTVPMNTLDYVVPAYYTIATAEASANLARFNGIRYGLRPEWSENPEELIRKSRHDGFGDEVKLRILLGTYVLRSGFQDQYYHRAQKIRTAIRNEFNEIFLSNDIILMPVFPTPAFKHGESELDSFQQKLADKFTSTANLAGLPALSFPAGLENGLPIGMQFIAPAFEEKRLFNAARQHETLFAVPKVPGYSENWS